MRLRNVPKDAKIAFAVQVTAPLTLSLLNEADAKRHPQPAAEALFTAPVSSSLSFSVTAPATGDYYLLLDNAQGTAPAKARIQVQAARGSPAPAELPPTRPYGDRPAPPLPLRERTQMHEM